jgi:hypothetical protein
MQRNCQYYDSRDRVTRTVISESKANTMFRSFVPQRVASRWIRTRATEPRSASLFWWWAFRRAASQTPCDGCPQKPSPEALVLTEGYSPAVPEPRGATPAQWRRNRQMRARRGAQGLLIALTIFGPVSCGKTDGGRPVYPVHGQVFFRGKPTPGALVLFHPVNDPDPQAPRPHGRVDVEEASQASELSSTPEGVSRRDRHAPLNGIVSNTTLSTEPLCVEIVERA